MLWESVLYMEIKDKTVDYFIFRLSKRQSRHWLDAKFTCSSVFMFTVQRVDKHISPPKCHVFYPLKGRFRSRTFEFQIIDLAKAIFCDLETGHFTFEKIFGIILVKVDVAVGFFGFKGGCRNLLFLIFPCSTFVGYLLLFVLFLFRIFPAALFRSRCHFWCIILLPNRVQIWPIPVKFRRGMMEAALTSD